MSWRGQIDTVLRLKTYSKNYLSCEHLIQTTCECGFTSMEESHMKVVEELQRQHQQEVERLLVDRDRLLEEEIAATATGEETLPLLSFLSTICFILKILLQGK